MTKNIFQTNGVFSACLIIVVLFFGREIFVPLALALLLAFLLEPLASFLERCHLGRTGSVLLAIFIVAVVLSGVTMLVSKQLGQLGGHLPEYKDNFHARLQGLREGNFGVAARALKSWQDFRMEISATKNQGGAGTNAAPSAQSRPIPVEVRNEDQTALKIVEAFISPSLSFLLKFVLVAVFCIFMLVGREDLRRRITRVLGPAKLTAEFLEETSARLSRYLLMQLTVNAGYGLLIGIALWLVGLPNPILWGISAALFRFVPYAGPWIGAALPFGLALAVDSGWGKPLMVLAVFAAFEIVVANFIEPWLYGQSTGITPFAVLLAAVFWTWLWGPVGLLLSMPLTVAVISFARHFPELEMVDQLFGESGRKPHSKPG